MKFREQFNRLEVQIQKRNNYFKHSTKPSLIHRIGKDLTLQFDQPYPKQRNNFWNF